MLAGGENLGIALKMPTRPLASSVYLGHIPEYLNYTNLNYRMLNFLKFTLKYIK